MNVQWSFPEANDLWYHKKLNAKADVIQPSSLKLDIKILKNSVIVHTNFLVLFGIYGIYVNMWYIFLFYS